MTRTHTYVTLEVSRATFDEIRTKLQVAHYEHTFEYESRTAHNQGPHRVVSIDMNGLALVPAPHANCGMCDQPINDPNMAVAQNSAGTTYYHNYNCSEVAGCGACKVLSTKPLEHADYLELKHSYACHWCDQHDQMEVDETDHLGALYDHRRRIHTFRFIPKPNR